MAAFYMRCILTIFLFIHAFLLIYMDMEELIFCFRCREIKPIYDYIIVGAGTAGCVVANRLAANNRTLSILLIEAGGRTNNWLSIPFLGLLLQQSTFDWKYTTTKQKEACGGFRGGKCHIPAGKILGGSHALSYMVYTRGHPSDYDSWFADYSEYSYEKDVEPYFDRAEYVYVPKEEEEVVEPTDNNDDISESQKVETITSAPAYLSTLSYISQISERLLKAFSLLGHRISEPTQHFFGGFYRPLLTLRNGRRWTTADYLLEQNYPNVQILTKARADKIIIRRTRAFAVKFQYSGVNYIVRARQAIISSAGTIGSAKLLMLSGIGPKKHLKKKGINVVKSLPVGNNLQDQTTIGHDMIMTQRLGLSYIELLNPVSWFQYFYMAQGPLTYAGIELVGFANNRFVHCKNLVGRNTSKCYKLYQNKQAEMAIFFQSLGLTDFEYIGLRSLLGVKKQIWRNYFSSINESTVSLLPILLHPWSKGSVRLANKNPLSMPLIDPRYSTHSYDARLVFNALLQAKKVLDKTLQVGLNMHLYTKHFPGCEQWEHNSLCYWHCYRRLMTTTWNNMIGTCRMGIKKDSVVNYDFCVHGIERLFVVDASVFPSHISGPGLGAVIMMAERAADTIQRYYRFSARGAKWGRF